MTTNGGTAGDHWAETHVSTDEAETTDGVMDDSGEDSDSEEDAWDVCAVPKIFTTEDVRRLFKVQKTVRVGGLHRPTFEYFGFVVETSLEEGSSSESTIVERDLTICLRYEPPSPKFKHQCPHYASYRLKLSRGSEFIYS
eukprot:CAMPEP_0118949120 /NCGR_PEP_ID=MMETSP1169-20130426/49068_1 /TAXON_ID=36882 /ORGANISM="Pyramimonas obovata, Strain CCMP722" /LENGTH=139 /DNA_ID=CAMNT_0006895681 /DNA_START=226 /DNA_END=642 /DNA_ORIENTATION=+